MKLPKVPKLPNSPTALICACVRAAVLLCLIASSPAQPPSVGTIVGRVSNPNTQVFLELVRVTVEGTSLETFTDSSGQYRIVNVPNGAVKVKAFRTGLVPETKTVTVAGDAPVQCDFSMTSPEEQAYANSPIQLEEFTVTTKEMDGAAIAINTQRFAINSMNVVAADEFGPVSIGNVGEVLKSVPGVTIGLGGLGAAYTISLNGVPPDNVPVSIGGFTLANAAGGINRPVGVNQISLNNTSRVETVYTSTPESTGSALAGSINLVPRSAFERSRPIYNLTAAVLFRDEDRNWGRTPGPLSRLSRKITPSLDFAALVPVNKRFGFTVSASTVKVYAPQDFSQNNWRGVGSATNGTTLPDTTPDQPYLTDYAVRDFAAMQTRTTGGLTAEYKFTPNDRVMLSYQGGLTVSEEDGRTLTFFVNQVRPGNFSTSYTHGIAGAGEIRLNNQADTLVDTLHMPSISYWHNGPIWKADAGLGFSRSLRKRTDATEGYFDTAQASRKNVTVSFDDIFYLRPQRISVADGTTGQALDPYSLNNYTVDTAGNNGLETMALERNAFASIKRDLTGRIPVTLKAGVNFRQSIKDIRTAIPTYSYVGADGKAGTADDNAGAFLDESFSQRPVAFGFPTTQRLSSEELLQAYQAHPNYFTTNDTTTYNANVAQSKHAEEIISAAYIRGDTELLQGRLKLMGGVRVEQTNDKGEGRLIDPTRNFQRDASGKTIFGPNGVALPITTNALDAAHLTNVDRGLRASKEYLRWFPSIDAAYNVRDNFIARFDYYQSVGRPSFGQYAGSLTLPNTDLPSGPGNLITVNNAAIKAWDAKTYKVSLEYYFEPVGLLSVSAFQRNIKNFFGATVFTPDAAFLKLYSLDPTVYGNYDVSTQYNLPDDVKMTGVDINYKQALTFLPDWARGVQVFANASSLRTQGPAAANFAGFVPRTANLGISLNRPKYILRMRWNYYGRQRRGLVAAGSSIDPNTYNWGSKRLLIDVSGEYNIYKQVSFFASVNNLNDAPVDLKIAAPNTPAVAQFRQRTQYGPLWTVGFKATY